jgi:LysR family glycine cleavage system transcriptional activator
MRERLTAFLAPSLLRDGIAPEDVPLCESGTRQGELDRWLASAGIRRIGQKRRRFAHFYIAYEAALAGEGLIVAPGLLTAADVAAERLVAPWPEIEVPGAPLALVFPSTPAMRGRIAPLLAWLQSEIGRAGSAGG